MMKKLMLMMLCLPMLSATVKAAGDQKVASKVEKVIVFLNGAQVTRTATVNVTTGESTITFEGLSPDIDAQSIQVHADGAFTIMSVKNELNFLGRQVKQKKVEELQAMQKTLRDKIDLHNSALAIYRTQEDMLSKNQVVTGQNANLDILKLKAALDFQAQTLTELKKKEQQVGNDITLLNEELQKYDRQIADITKGDTKITNDVIVTISSKIVVQTKFSLSYIVKNAGWYPTYDVRAKDVNSPINIAYKANVSQKCGEEWKNVKLTLSTANPTVSGSKPQLNPYYLNFGMIYQGQSENVTKVVGRLYDNKDGSALIGATIKVKGTSIGATTDANGQYSIQVPQGSPILQFNYVGYQTIERRVNSGNISVGMSQSQNQLNEVVIGYGSNNAEGIMAGVNVAYDKVEYKASAYQVRGNATLPVIVEQTENQTNIEFNISNPYTIPGDGKQYLVEIGNYDLNATFEYYVAPKLNTDVFLTSQIIDWNKYNFLSGEANLFFEGTYIGKSLLDTHASSDTLNLSLGVDKNIVVTRTLQKNLTQRQIIGSNKKETKDWVIEVKNRKNQPVNLLVEDQIPVSQNTSIEVERQEVSGGKVNDTDGKVQWTLKMAPSEDKKVELKYQVKYPKNQQVIVQ
ncbi:mucoidy inhibitor MuiA family protein [Mucilaginibacter sp. HMF5004]|uniref:mucoidy inhibitor MuiA family protein n=1 Tax=Mucilaginibacter rivuli TaxID=2857527 RepID=UPI001C5E5987|nr:mucoidy inhibitor MuiA family protein [Mucilaginibacter rivuli]MBW4889645.1 mucoidy inhibitor MuiA family protein [Mucilaginibacter rivuli]